MLISWPHVLRLGSPSRWYHWCHWASCGCFGMGQICQTWTQYLYNIYIYVDVYSTLKYEFRNTTCQNLPNMERLQSKTVSFAMSGEFFGDLLSLRMIWLNHKNSTDWNTLAIFAIVTFTNHHFWWLRGDITHPDLTSKSLAQCPVLSQAKRDRRRSLPATASASPSTDLKPERIQRQW